MNIKKNYINEFIAKFMSNPKNFWFTIIIIYIFIKRNYINYINEYKKIILMNLLQYLLHYSTFIYTRVVDPCVALSV